MTLVVLLHGIQGSADSCFLPGLLKRFKDRAEVLAPSLSNSESPQFEKWIQEVQELVKGRVVDVCICHSLGGTLAMNMITQGLLQVKTLVTVGSSHGPKDDPLMDAFLEPPLSMSALKKLDKFYAIASYDDPATHSDYSALLVKQAGAVGLFYANQGHFLENDLPEEVLILLDAALQRYS